MQRLLGGSPERAEDESMALSGSFSSHTHPTKPQQQVEAGCLSQECAYNTGTMDTTIRDRHSICCLYQSNTDQSFTFRPQRHPQARTGACQQCAEAPR